MYFHAKKSNLGIFRRYILEGLGLENVGIFYGHLEYIIDVWNILWHFGIFCGRLWYTFSCYGTLYQKHLATLPPVCGLSLQLKPFRFVLSAISFQRKDEEFHQTIRRRTFLCKRFFLLILF
jgi:hypothetical protein